MRLGFGHLGTGAWRQSVSRWGLMIPSVEFALTEYPRGEPPLPTAARAPFQGSLKTRMQNRYVGDVGDYGKYALLRALCRSTAAKSIRLGVIWCLFPDEHQSNDGKHISYLDDQKFA